MNWWHVLLVAEVLAACWVLVKAVWWVLVKIYGARK